MYIYTWCSFVQVLWDYIHCHEQKSQPSKSHVDAPMCQPVDLQCTIFFCDQRLFLRVGPQEWRFSLLHSSHFIASFRTSYEEGLTTDAGGVYHP